MKLSTTLAAVALMAAAAPSAFALSVKDDDMKLDLKAVIQMRAEHVHGRSTNSGDGVAGGTTTISDVENNGLNTQPDPLDFYLRRVRIGFTGTYKNDTKFSLMLMGPDGTDRPASTAGSKASDSRTVSVHTAMAAREIKTGDDFKHTVRFGLYSAFFNSANYVSSSEFQLVTQRATNQLLSQRGAGVGYMLDMPVGTIGFDVQNNNAEQTQNDASGLFYSGRLQLTPPKSSGWNIEKYTECWAGAEGKGIMLVAEAGLNDRAVSGTAPDEIKTNQRVYGFELLGHIEQLSFLAEYRTRETFTTTGTNPITSDEDVTSTVWLFQAGYAVPVATLGVIEPVVRYTSIDLNEGSTTTAGRTAEFANYGTNNDYATGSGRQYEFGVNWYFDKHKNKVGLLYQHWDAEAGPGQMDRAMAQYQLSF